MSKASMSSSSSSAAPVTVLPTVSWTAANEYVSALIVRVPEAATELQEVQDLAQKKLWHQLLLRLDALSTSPLFTTAPRFLDLFQHFIIAFHAQFNALSFAHLAVFAALQAASAADALAVLESALATIKADAQANVLVSLAITRYLIRQYVQQAAAASSSEDVVMSSSSSSSSSSLSTFSGLTLRKERELEQWQQFKDRLDTSKHALDSFAGVMDTKVYSAFYATQCEYHAAREQDSEFFDNAILYLTYTPLSALSVEQRNRWAVEIALSGVVAPKTYNYGRLLEHEIVQVLQRNAEFEWLYQLVSALNSGDIDAFHAARDRVFANEAGINKALAQVYASGGATTGATSHLLVQPVSVMRARTAFLDEKIRIMALIDVVFRRPSVADRLFTFAELASAVRLPVEQIEALLLKALALQVIRGSVDEVDSTIRIKWVQPRILELTQLQQVRARLAVWQQDVSHAISLMHEHAGGIVGGFLDGSVAPVRQVM